MERERPVMVRKTISNDQPALGKLFTAQELAERWHKNVLTLSNDRSARRGPRYLKLGGKVFYREADVAAWENSQAVETFQSTVIR
jgi:hypothetical protein